MNLFSYIILALVLLAFAFALGFLLKRRGRPGCGDCASPRAGDGACRDCPLRENCDRNRTDGNQD